VRRIALAISIAISLGLVFAPAVGAASGDRVSGFGTRAPSCVGCPVGNFSFDARSGRNGQNPSGWYSIEFPGYATFVGSVTCLNVSGKWATIVGQITNGQGAGDPSTFPPSGTDPVYFAVVVHGKGAPYRGSPAPDEMSFTVWDTEAGWLSDPGVSVASLCTDGPAAVGTDMFKLVAGDIRVRDR